MKRILLLLVSLVSFSSLAQQDVFSRDNSGTGDWSSTNNPWFYGGDKQNPDNNGTVRNFVKIGHNNNTTMLTNGRYFILNSLDFQGGASSPRTINNSNGGLSISGGIYNASSGTHTFNTPIGIDGSLVRLHANASGGLSFTNTIFVNSNTVEFGNLGSGTISVSGVIEGGGQVAKVGNNILTFSGQNTYTGTTTVTAGTLQLNRIGGSTLPAMNNVTVGTGATLRISQNQTLNNITLNGGTLTVDSGVELIVKELISTGTSTITGTGIVKLTDFLTVSSGTFTTNDNLILRSTSAGTARVTQVGGTISGLVTVERYLTGRRAFRFLTPSVTTTTSIFANWQNAGATTAGIGTHITGSTTGANGFDTTTTGNPSMFTYNAQATGTTTGFTAVPNTDVTTLKAGAGYRILVRGDRNVDLTAASANNMNVPTTLSARGTLTTGTVTFDSSGASPAPVNNQAGNTQTNGFTLIGNPYASPVDWHAVTKTGVAANAYYTWDPTLGTSTQRGRYVVYSQDSGTANLLDDNSGLPLNSRQYLQTGQAVFIKNANLATPATLVFNESNKASTNQYVFRNSEAALTSTNSSLYLSVYEPNELALGGNAIDGAAALFGVDYTTALDNNDVEKLVATGENLAFVRTSKNLAIETVAPVQPNDVLFVKTIAFQPNKNYTFKVNTQNFDASVTAKMVDMYLNTETPLDVTQPSFVTFSTTADANSYGSERFKIVFNSTALENDDFATNAISVYPNPIVNNQFNIALPSSVTGTVNVSITNMLGQEVYKSTSDAAQTMLVRPNQPLQEGVYVVSVNNNGKIMQTKVIVKN
ncbi:T9SS type A sorting domain-containing protein [Flavobacterium sp.]|uniref:T9SS type A sorting domain-containing protein n=1 Tax=Flavobacterium sp. TaxID=239 RepID=UPI000EBAEEA5|nr:T9SS type A sorting domain-containing protein [Flavobacterium sp.]HCQ11843.1 hypothetical protein [Flavobacterium sp.]